MTFQWTLRHLRVSKRNETLIRSNISDQEKSIIIKRYTERNTKRQIYRKITDNTAEAYLGLFQRSKNELFTKIINGF